MMHFVLILAIWLVLVPPFISRVGEIIVIEAIMDLPRAYIEAKHRGNIDAGRRNFFWCFVYKLTRCAGCVSHWVAGAVALAMWNAWSIHSLPWIQPWLLAVLCWGASVQIAAKVWLK